MRPEQRSAILYQATGVGLYLVGLFLFLSVAVETFSSAPGSATLTTGDYAMLVTSIVAITAGRWLSRRRGFGRESFTGLGTTASSEPDQSRLEELGYHVPPDATDEDTDTAADTDPDGEDSVVCRQCGTRNDAAFSFCSDCSAELPN